MGAYLAFGLNYRASVSQSQLERSGWDEGQLLQFMVEELDFPADNYARVPTAKDVIWELRTDVLEQQLIPLLERVYPLLYPKAGSSNPWWREMTQELMAMSPDTWIAWAESSEENWAFRVEGYADEWYRLRGSSQKEVSVDFYHIRLMMEGKFLMEEWQNSFHFIQHCITRAFPTYPLSRSLRIYVLG